MKAQTLGLVLGINIVAACLMIQGCAAPGSEKDRAERARRERGAAPTEMRSEKPVPPSPSANKQVITVKPAAPRTPPPPPVQTVPPPPAPVQPVPPPPATVEPVQPVPPPPAPAQPVVARPSAVRTVKALPAPAPKSPKVKSAAAAVPAGATTEYVVKPGDTIFLISKRTNFRQDAIIAANPGLKPDRLRVGQKIKLPGAAVAKSAASEAKPVAPEAKLAVKDAKNKDGKEMDASAPVPNAADTKPPIKTKSGFVPYEGPTKDYTVKSGDSLGKIASECGISIRALKALNGLQKDNLRIGMKLKIPAEKQTAASKAPAAKDGAADVKKPDVEKKDPAVKEPSASATAAGANAVAATTQPPAATKTDDAAAAETPKPVEGAKADEVAPKVEEVAKPEEPPTLTYKVKEGDDLVSIAIAYGISPSALMDLNDLKATDEIKPGQILKLPANAKASAQ